jgi:hypothetical protein
MIAKTTKRRRKNHLPRLKSLHHLRLLHRQLFHPLLHLHLRLSLSLRRQVKLFPRFLLLPGRHHKKTLNLLLPSLHNRLASLLIIYHPPKQSYPNLLPVPQSPVRYVYLVWGSLVSQH